MDKKRVYLLLAMAAVSLLLSACRGGESPDRVVAAQVVQIYDEIMNRSHLHSKVPPEASGKHRTALHFQYTYEEMSARFADVVSGEQNIPAETERRVLELVNIAAKTADLSGQADAINPEHDIDAPPYPEIRRLNRLLASHIRDFREKM